MKTFAAVDIGSYELSMKIFEFSGKNRMREIDHIRHRIDLGTETYFTGKLSYEKADELSRVLREFAKIMEAYKVDDYQAYGTSAVREMENSGIVLDRLAQRTGIRIDVVSNSEQRFLDYKSIASKGEKFDKLLEKGAVILDIGGGSIQISLFDKGSLTATQNLRLGALWLRERLGRINAKPSQLEELLVEISDAQLAVLKKLYFKDKEIKNIILVDDYLSGLLGAKAEQAQEAGYASAEEYRKLMEFMRKRSAGEIAVKLGISEENASLMFIAAVLLNQVMAMTGAELVWAPGVTLCDGIAYEYAQKRKLLVGGHDFEKDIVDSAMSISKRYMGSRKRAETLENLTMVLFEATKKLHGLGKREQLLLRIAAILHDCGKYISMASLGECSYQIIMATEIIGLSHLEREIIANVVKFNHEEFIYYEELSRDSSLDMPAYLKMAKLTAILRLANGMDRSHKQKFKNIKAQLRENELVLTADTGEDITLEKGLFTNRAQFFEEVFNVRPVIKQKKSL